MEGGLHACRTAAIDVIAPTMMFSRGTGPSMVFACQSHRDTVLDIGKRRKMRRKRRPSTGSVNIFAGVAGGAGANINHARVMRRRDYPQEAANCQGEPSGSSPLPLMPIFLLLTKSVRAVFDVWRQQG